MLQDEDECLEHRGVMLQGNIEWILMDFGAKNRGGIDKLCTERYVRELAEVHFSHLYRDDRDILLKDGCDFINLHTFPRFLRPFWSKSSRRLLSN